MPSAGIGFRTVCYCHRRAYNFQEQLLVNPSLTCIQLAFNYTSAYDQFIGNVSSYQDVINASMYQNSSGAVFAWYNVAGCTVSLPAICELPGAAYQCPPAPPPRPPPPSPDPAGPVSLCE